jgi:hypothetical protein
MILILTASNRFFTREGTSFLKDLNKYKVGGNDVVYLDETGKVIMDQKIIQKFY